MTTTTKRLLQNMTSAAAARYVALVAKRIDIQTTDAEEAFLAYAAIVGERQARGLLVVAY